MEVSSAILWRSLDTLYQRILNSFNVLTTVWPSKMLSPNFSQYKVKVSTECLWETFFFFLLWLICQFCLSLSVSLSVALSLSLSLSLCLSLSPSLSLSLSLGVNLKEVNNDNKRKLFGEIYTAIDTLAFTFGNVWVQTVIPATTIHPPPVLTCPHHRNHQDLITFAPCFPPTKYVAKFHPIYIKHQIPICGLVPAACECAFADVAC